MQPQPRRIGHSISQASFPVKGKTFLNVSCGSSPLREGVSKTSNSLSVVFILLFLHFKSSPTKGKKFKLQELPPFAFWILDLGCTLYIYVQRYTLAPWRPLRLLSYRADVIGVALASFIFFCYQVEVVCLDNHLFRWDSAPNSRIFTPPPFTHKNFGHTHLKNLDTPT